MRLIVARYVPLARFVRDPMLNSGDGCSLNEIEGRYTSKQTVFGRRMVRTESRITQAPKCKCTSATA
jgi:hypothetical protein